MTPLRHRASWRVAAGIATLVTSGCGGRSIFNPAGPAARSLSRLGWLVLGTFVITTIVMWLLIGYVACRRRGSLAEHEPPDVEGGIRWILIGGFAIPAVVLSIVFVATLQSMAAFPMEHADGDLQIHVWGHRWWFEAQYRTGRLDQWVTTATDIHIPVGHPVDIALESRDVIHAFWVPQLHGKVDLIPGMTNHIRIQADAPGRYDGQCAEFCGKQHASMRIHVIAEPFDAFQMWLEGQRRPAAVPETDETRHGQQLVNETACALCHTVRGTFALGTVGPDLTHVASRTTIAGGTFDNNIANLHAWITHAQSLKPGAEMPDLTQYKGRDLHDMVAYLRMLR
jgi:cytochrome c oxidase subunit 2